MRSGIAHPRLLRQLCAPLVLSLEGLLAPSVVQEHSLRPSPVRRRSAVADDGDEFNRSGSLSLCFRLSTISFPYQLPCFDNLPNSSALRVKIVPLFSQPYKLLSTQMLSFDIHTNCRGVYHPLKGNFRCRAGLNLFYFMLLRALLHTVNNQLSRFQLLAHSFAKTRVRLPLIPKKFQNGTHQTAVLSTMPPNCGCGLYLQPTGKNGCGLYLQPAGRNGT